jgi:hypothetical protein
MNYCSKNNIKAVIASIDQSKAFDSVDHGFMEKVYDFFGFGEQIKRWLKSIGTNRLACIQLENDAITDKFELGKGHAQGDSPSPLLYNLAAQIQIFKLELNPNIPKIMNEEIDVARNLLPPLFYKQEGLGQTETNESFADDSSNLTLFTFEALAELKNVLDSFKILSGLSCNLEKSFVMRIGNTLGEVPQEVANLGFTFVNKINLLGFTLCSYGDSVAANYEKVIQRITNLTRFWDRFKLGLTAKISIYKSLLLPQINYVATIFTPPPETMAVLEKTMENFVVRGFTIAKNRIYLPVDKGGLGLFKLGDFITGLQCSWIKRCFHLINDNWRARLVQSSNGSIANSVNDSWVKGKISPVLSNILDSYNKFRAAYTRENSNYKVVPIYCNDAFGYGRGLANKLNDNFFDINPGTPRDVRARVLTVTWSDVTANSNLLPRDTVSEVFGLNLSQIQYDNIKNAYRSAQNRFKNNTAPTNNLDHFFLGFKKGSQPFRRILSSTSYTDNETVGGGLRRSVKSFCSLIDCQAPNNKRIKSLFCTWNRVFLDSRMRIFKFKYYNNIIGLNTRVAHFNPEISAGCTVLSVI